MLWEEQHRYLAEMGNDTFSNSNGNNNSSSSSNSSSSVTPSRKRKLGEVDENNTGDADGETSFPQTKKPRTGLLGILHEGIDGIRLAAQRASVALFGAVHWVYNMGAAAVSLTNPQSGSHLGSGRSGSSSSGNSTRGTKTTAGTSRKKVRDGDVQMTVFRALQDSKYFIGPGDVYGGDYTIYRGGDPSNAHSTATVRVVRQRKITARDLISFSRVQNQVAKSAVLAFLDPESKEAKFVVVNFQTVSDRS